MSTNRLSLLPFMLAAVLAFAAAARAAAPGAGYTREDRENMDSPDGTVRIEQYSKPMEDGGAQWQFWIMPANGRSGFLLNKKPQEYYPAGFRFSPDSRWLVRMQKTGAGYAEVRLYRRRGLTFVEASKGPLSDLAWDYYQSQHRRLGLPAHPQYHNSCDLIRGYEENYRWLGYHWPPGRYLILSLNADNLHRFWCGYDTETKTFFRPNTAEVRRTRAAKPEPEPDEQ